MSSQALGLEDLVKMQVPIPQLEVGLRVCIPDKLPATQTQPVSEWHLE